MSFFNPNASELLTSFSNIPKVYPTLAAGVTITSGTAWALGSAAVIVPANTITSNFKIQYVSFAVFSATATYEVIFYKGEVGSEIEIGRLRTTGTSSVSQLAMPFYSEIIEANTRISAKSACLSGTNSVICSIVYVTV